jgi:hypothetical protein
MKERKEKTKQFLIESIAEVPSERELLESWEKIYLHALRDNASLLDVAMEKYAALTGTPLEKLSDRLRMVSSQEGYAKTLNRVRARIDSMLVGV